MVHLVLLIFKMSYEACDDVSLCMAYLKFLLLGFLVAFEGLYVAEVGAAFLVVVFLVMFALHHVLISLTQILL